MKQLSTPILFIAMMAGTVLSGYFGPWYAPSLFIMILSVITGLSDKKGMWLGGTTLGLVYLCMALWQYSQDHSDLMSKIGFLLGELSPVALIIQTTVIGVITGTLSGWLGSRLAGFFKKA